MRKQSKQTYSVYGLHCPLSGAIRWVGMTTNPKKRYTAHLYNQGSEDADKYTWIKRLRGKNLKPKLIIFKEVTSKPDALKLEMDLIIENRETIYNKNNGTRQVAKPKKFWGTDSLLANLKTCGINLKSLYDKKTWVGYHKMYKEIKEAKKLKKRVDTYMGAINQSLVSQGQPEIDYNEFFGKYIN